MPTLTIDKKDLLELVGKKVSDERLQDRISMLGTDLEKVTKDEIEVEVFPNRPDMLSTEGFARALSSFMGIKKGLRKYKLNNSRYSVKVDKKVGKIRGEVSCAVIKNINLDEGAIKSLMQVQEKLHISHGRNRKKISIGVYDLDKIKFPLTYTTKSPSFKFIPLETQREYSLKDILIKHPKGNEFAHLLSGFNEYPIWIDSKGQVLSMPPVINSEQTKVGENTKNLFVDVTGTDKRGVEQALNILVTSLADRGGKIYSVKLNGKKCLDLGVVKLKIDIYKINKILGLELSKVEIKLLHSKMGYGSEKGKASIPCYRTDVLGQVDLAEDIAIAYGYENFKASIPNIATIAQEDKFEQFKNKITNILIGFGLLETNTYNLTSKEVQTKKMQLDEKGLKLLEIENALNEEYDVMRAWMIPSLLEVIKNNKQYEYPQKIFEIGDVFTPNQKARLGVVLADKLTNYTKIKQILEYLLSTLGLSYEIRETKHNSFIGGRVGRVYTNGKAVAYLGEIHPQVLDNFDLDVPISALELNLNELFKILRK